MRTSLRDEFLACIQAADMPTLLVTYDEAEARAMVTRAVRLRAGQLESMW